MVLQKLFAVSEKRKVIRPDRSLWIRAANLPLPVRPSIPALSVPSVLMQDQCRTHPNFLNRHHFLDPAIKAPMTKNHNINLAFFRFGLILAVLGILIPDSQAADFGYDYDTVTPIG